MSTLPSGPAARPRRQRQEVVATATMFDFALDALRSELLANGRDGRWRIGPALAFVVSASLLLWVPILAAGRWLFR